MLAKALPVLSSVAIPWKTAICGDGKAMGRDGGPSRSIVARARKGTSKAIDVVDANDVGLLSRVGDLQLIYCKRRSNGEPERRL